MARVAFVIGVSGVVVHRCTETLCQVAFLCPTVIHHKAHVEGPVFVFLGASWLLPPPPGEHVYWHAEVSAGFEDSVLRRAADEVKFC